MSASLAVQAILGVLALGACLMVAFICLRQVFRHFAAHGPTGFAPDRASAAVPIRRMDEAARPLPGREPPASNVN